MANIEKRTISLPEEHAAALAHEDEDVAVGQFVRELLDDVDGRVEYDDVTALGYAIYHLPDYYAAVQYPLADLASDGLLPRRLRVLDVGAGVGGPALGVHDLLPEDSLVEYHAIEPSAAGAVFESMLDGSRPSLMLPNRSAAVSLYAS